MFSIMPNILCKMYYKNSYKHSCQIKTNEIVRLGVRVNLFVKHIFEVLSFSSNTKKLRQFGKNGFSVIIHYTDTVK